MKCNVCGGENSQDAKFCVFCGTPFEVKSQEETPEKEYQNGENRPQNNQYSGPVQDPVSERDKLYYGLYDKHFLDDNKCAHTLAVLSIIIGVISLLFASVSIFTGTNYGAIAAFVLAVGAVVKARKGCETGVKTAAVIIAVIAMGVSVLCSFIGNVTFQALNDPDLQEFYGDFYDDFYNDFGNGSQDDFLGEFNDDAGNGELV